MKKHLRVYLMVLLISVVPALSISGVIREKPRTYVCYQTKEGVVIDGILDEKDWEMVPWTENFIDITGSNDKSPPLKTRIKMIWDQHALYIAAELEEPHIWATLTERESVIFYDNDFEVFIDPNGDNHNYMELEMNALGTEWDLFLDKPYKDKGNPLSTWNLEGWEKAIKIHGTLNDPSDIDTCWIIEMRLQLASILENHREKDYPAENTVWRMNFSRVQWETSIRNGKYEKAVIPETGEIKAEKNWVWSPQWVVNMHNPETWGYIIFTEKSPLETDPGQFAFPDPDFDLKMCLIDLYKDQKELFLNERSYAISFDQLNLDHSACPYRFELNSSVYSYVITGIPGKDYVWKINQDRKLWKDYK